MTTQQTTRKIDLLEAAATGAHGHLAQPVEVFDPLAGRHYTIREGAQVVVADVDGHRVRLTGVTLSGITSRVGARIVVA